MKGAKMKKIFFSFLLIPFIFSSLGCVPLIVGGAAGAVGAYAITKDTIQGETDKPYDRLWDAAYRVSKIQGIIRQEDSLKGELIVDISHSKVTIKLIRLTHATTRIRISARKYSLPNRDLAENLYTKIMEEAQ